MAGNQSSKRAQYTCVFGKYMQSKCKIQQEKKKMSASLKGEESASDVHTFLLLTCCLSTDSPSTAKSKSVKRGPVFPQKIHACNQNT